MGIRAKLRYPFDNACGEHGFKYFQLVPTVTEEGGAVHTINLCKQCCNERRVQQGEQPLKTARWREMVEQKAYRGKLWQVVGTVKASRAQLWQVVGMEQFMRGKIR